MNFLTILAAIIAPVEHWAEQKLASIGSSFLSAMGVIFNEFENDQRAIAANVIAFWQHKHAESVTAGASSIEAMEKATTAALNEFYNEERQDLQKVVSMTVTALEVSVANGLKS